ncbi:MAG TPA: MFS transporter [Steroidobacteraceae bacterium]|nr:MFS transporter [Steroidobacteraceae bacterium]
MPSRAAPTDAPFLRVRFLILGGVVAAAFTAYLERRAIAVAGAQMMPALGIGEIELGYLFNAFLFTYTVLQYPGGLLAQRIGARRLTTACLLVSTLGTALTALMPGLAGPVVAFVGVGIAQALVGIGQGPLFPANAGIVQAWFPPRHWALMNGLQVTGLSLGAAAAPPLIAALMQSYGWRNALYATCVPATLLALWWSRYVRNKPREHRAMTPAELAEIEPEPRTTTAPRVSWAEVRRLLGDRNVMVLSCAYLLMNYVFYFFNQWSFLYLVEERHLTLLKSGWLASIPLVFGAICATVGGVLCGAACRRLGARRGFRLVPLVVLPLSGALLLVAAHADDAYLAVAALAGCYGCVQMTESAFWGATFWAARERAAAATGVLNMFGNLGGIIGTPIVAWLAHAHQWPGALATGVAFALASALLWLWVDVEHRGVPA